MQRWLPDNFLPLSLYQEVQRASNKQVISLVVWQRDFDLQAQRIFLFAKILVASLGKWQRHLQRALKPRELELLCRILPKTFGS
jgi:hypothetical protein